MITRDIPIRVRYYETDCMGFVHHSNYVRYYETARTEMLRELGMTYPELEAQGIMLPVIDVQSRYVSPAFDDDLLTVRVTLAEMPKVKMRFDYEVFRENGERINTGSVTPEVRSTLRWSEAASSFIHRMPFLPHTGPSGLVCRFLRSHAAGRSSRAVGGYSSILSRTMSRHSIPFS